MDLQRGTTNGTSEMTPEPRSASGDGAMSRAHGAGSGAAGGIRGQGKGAAVPLLSLQSAAKAFGAVQAIADASIDLHGGEAHALVGENGAGKSTLVKILAGVHRPDSGRVLIEGEEVVFDTSAQSHA